MVASRDNRRVRALIGVLGAQLLLGIVFITLIATGNVPFVDGATPKPGPAVVRHQHGFDGRAAFRWLKLEVGYGERPAGSPASRALAERLRTAMPNATFEPIAGGLRNIVAKVPGRDPRRYVVVGAHYDTRATPGNVGANDGAGGSSAVVQLSRQLRPRSIGPTVYFVLFDGEEPAGASDSDFYNQGLRGSKVAAKRFSHAQAMILLDFVAGRRLSLAREGSSDARLWARLRKAARRGGVGAFFPDSTEASIIDDQTPFQHEGIRAIDLIDWSFPCNDQPCDNLTAVSESSLYASGEAVWNLLPTL